MCDWSNGAMRKPGSRSAQNGLTAWRDRHLFGVDMDEDANNYYRILSILGMEEEGDSVAEVRRLKDKMEELEAARFVISPHIDHRPGSTETDDLVAYYAMYPGNVVESLTKLCRRFERERARWKQIAEFEYAIRTYPSNLDLGEGALDEFFKKWNYSDAKQHWKHGITAEKIKTTVEF